MTQSRPFVVAMSASLPAASANVHHAGANSSRTIRPPAASAAATRASACSAGNPHGDVDRPAAIGARLLHLLEPERRSSAARIDEVLVRRVAAADVAERSLPER